VQYAEGETEQFKKCTSRGRQALGGRELEQKGAMLQQGSPETPQTKDEPSKHQNADQEKKKEASRQVQH